MAELELAGGGLATTLFARARMLRARAEMYMVALRDVVLGVVMKHTCEVERYLDEVAGGRQPVTRRSFKDTVGPKPFNTFLTNQNGLSFQVSLRRSHEATG